MAEIRELIRIILTEIDQGIEDAEEIKEAEIETNKLPKLEEKLTRAEDAMEEGKVGRARGLSTAVGAQSKSIIKKEERKVEKEEKKANKKEKKGKSNKGKKK